jgi:hypothetical protein
MVSGWITVSAPTRSSFFFFKVKNSSFCGVFRAEDGRNHGRPSVVSRDDREKSDGLPFLRLMLQDVLKFVVHNA